MYPHSRIVSTFTHIILWICKCIISTFLCIIYIFASIMLFCNTCIFQNAMKVQMESMRKGSEVEKAWEGENLVWRWKDEKRLRAFLKELPHRCNSCEKRCGRVFLRLNYVHLTLACWQKPTQYVKMLWQNTCIRRTVTMV